jgi:orotidine-5'-phosphate decarboxylase
MTPRTDPVTADPRLIVALDVPGVPEAEALVATLGDAVSFYKIGLELAFAGGFDLARRLKGAGKSVFLDMKLHDIPNTVERATANVASLGVDLLTVHAYPQTMAAAAKGRAGSKLRLLGVTVLTSMSETDLAPAGLAGPVADVVARRTLAARGAGVDGVVCSPMEAMSARAVLGPGALVVTPGVRPAGTATGDQARVATPADALRAGASHLVVGRPITAAPDPRAAALSILAEMAGN